METQLFVLGDSHAHFWTGTGDRYGIDRLPGIRTTGIPGALAYNLVEEQSTTNSRQIATHMLYTMLREGFSGWVMLAFGTVDCETFVWRYAHEVGLEESIRRIIDRYMTFILQVKGLYPKVAVWGPLTTKQAFAHDSAVGTEVERNLAILVFGEMLRARLAEHGIPYIAMTEQLLGQDGRTRQDLFAYDNAHISQKMMPYALRLVNQALGLALTQGDGPIAYAERRVTKFASVEYVHEFDKHHLLFVLPEGAQFVTDVAILPHAFSDLHKVCITTTSDRGFEFEEHGCDGSVWDARGRYYLPVNRIARKIYIWGEMRAVQEAEIEIFVRGTQMHAIPDFDRNALLALRDQIVAPTAKASASTIPTLTHVSVNQSVA